MHNHIDTMSMSLFIYDLVFMYLNLSRLSIVFYVSLFSNSLLFSLFITIIPYAPTALDSDNFTASFQLKNSSSSNSKIAYNYLSSWDCDLKKPTEEEIKSKILELEAAEPMRLLREERDRKILCFFKTK